MTSRRAETQPRHYDVFISYSIVDETIARLLANELSGAGVAVFLDQFALRPGQDWASVTGDAISMAAAVVALMSPESSSVMPIPPELELALERGRMGKALFIPVVSTQQALVRLPPSLREFQGLVVRDQNDVRDAAAQIVAAIPERSLHSDDAAGLPTQRSPDDITSLEAAVAMTDHALGDDHPNALQSRSILAEAYYSSGRTIEALALYRRTFEGNVRILGPDHPTTLATRANLAAVSRDLGHYEEAAVLLAQTLFDSERILGGDHPSTLTTRANLAAVYRDLGRHVEANALLTRALADSERALGGEHPSTLTTRANLAAVYRDLGRYEEAAVLLAQTLADSDRILGGDHPSTLMTRANLAAVYRDMGRQTEATALLTQALSDSERALGPNHPTTNVVRQNLTVLLARRPGGLQ